MKKFVLSKEMIPSFENESIKQLFTSEIKLRLLIGLKNNKSIPEALADNAISKLIVKNK